jgi:hypothetical protein
LSRSALADPNGEEPRGVQTPRVTCVPAYVDSTGQEAVDLAAAAGLHLDPWQQLVLRESLGERADGKWAAFEVGLIVSRQNGKGAILEARELAGLFLLGERLILHSAHEFKTASEAFRRVLGLIEGCPDLEREVKKVRTSHGDEGVELKSGQRLRFVARSTGSGRGFTGDCIVLDEAYNLGPQAMAALLPTLSARPNPQLWYASSAGMPESVQLAAVRERALAGGSSGLAYFEWSAPDEADMDDRAAWAQANPALGFRITEEFIGLERDAMPQAEFARERLGIWEDASKVTVIPLGVWQASFDAESEIDGPVAFAVDSSPDRSRTSIAAAGVRGDGLAHVEVIQTGAGVGWAVEALTGLCNRWKPCAIVVDPRSSASSLLPDLEDVPEIAAVLIKTSTGDVVAATGGFYDSTMDGKLRHLGQPELEAALLGAAKRTVGDSWLWDRKNTSVDITPLVASTLALWGWTTRHGSGDILQNVW